MVKASSFAALAVLLGCASAFAQGPCSVQSSKLACVIPEERGAVSESGDFSQVFYTLSTKSEQYNLDLTHTLQPLSAALGRQANLLPLASPSSGFVFTYDPSLKTFVASTDSLGPILGERAETVGRHRLFIGFSYQFFNFDKLDGVNLNNFTTVLPLADDNTDNSPPSPAPAINCSINSANGSNLNGCGFIRDRVQTINSLDLKVNQYTAYVTFGLTRHIDLSMVIPVENVRMSLTSQDTEIPGTSGFITPTAGSPIATAPNQQTYPQTGPFTNGAPYFLHLFKNCPNTSPSSGASGLAPSCLNHTFPDPAFTGNGSNSQNSASGIGDVVARLKWNAWEGERAGFAAGLDLRFPTGDALNFLGSGSYGVTPFAVLSYRARISPHVLVGYEWNTDSITAGDLVAGMKGNVPNEFVFSAGADTRVTKWLTGDFDLVGQRVFGAETVAVTSQQFLANCGSCANPTPNTVTAPSLADYPN